MAQDYTTKVERDYHEVRAEYMAQIHTNLMTAVTDDNEADARKEQTSKAKVAAIVAARRAGWSIKDLAELVGVSKERVGQIIKAAQEATDG
jgi:Helix-turn-helix.